MRITSGSSLLQFMWIEFVRIARASVVALAATAVYMGTGLALHHGVGLGAGTSSVVAVLSAAPVSYFGHAWVTFEVTSARQQQAGRFAAAAALTMAFAWLGTYFADYFGLPYWVGLTAAILAAGVNYLLVRLYVFAAAVAVKDKV
jgi:putative flippase GtrA